MGGAVDGFKLKDQDVQVEELWSLDKEQFADLKPVFG